MLIPGYMHTYMHTCACIRIYARIDAYMNAKKTLRMQVQARQARLWSPFDRRLALQAILIEDNLGNRRKIDSKDEIARALASG